MWQSIKCLLDKPKINKFKNISQDIDWFGQKRKTHGNKASEVCFKSDFIIQLHTFQDQTIIILSTLLGGAHIF